MVTKYLNFLDTIAIETGRDMCILKWIYSNNVLIYKYIIHTLWEFQQSHVFNEKGVIL